jgi:hypothetical protein
MTNKFWLKYTPVYGGADVGGGGGSADAGSSSSPAATPAASSDTSSTPSPSPSPDSGSDGDAWTSAGDFDAIFSGGGAEPQEQPLSQPAATPSAPSQSAQPQPAAQPAAPPVQPPPAVPTAAQPQAPAATDTPTSASPSGPQIDPYDPGALAQYLAQNESEAIAHVASNHFKLTDKEIEALENNPVEVIPQLLAKAYVRAQRGALEQMGRLIPGMLQRQTAVMKKGQEHESKFFARWKDHLNPETHGETVRDLAVKYRQMNPQVPTEQMMEDVGLMAMVKLGIRPGLVAPGAPTQPSAMLPAGSRPQASPFQPAGPVAGGATQPTPVNMHPVEAMFMGNEG